MKRPSGRRAGMRGVLFIELLLAVSMAVMIGVGVYRTFASGISVWRRQTIDRLAADRYIFFDKLATDLRNYHRTPLTNFEAASARVSFLIHNPDYLLLPEKSLPAPEKAALRPLMRAEYIFNADRKEVARKLYWFGVSAPFASAVVLSGIDDFEFTFYVPVRGKGDVCMASVPGGQEPKAVAVRMGSADARGRSAEWRRTIRIPVNQ